MFRCNNKTSGLQTLIVPASYWRGFPFLSRPRRLPWGPGGHFAPDLGTWPPLLGVRRPFFHPTYIFRIVSIFRLGALAWPAAKYRFVWLLASLAAAPSCKSSEPEPTATTAPAAATVLTGSALIGEYSVAALAGRVQAVPLVGALARYPIRAYRLTYRTPRARRPGDYGLRGGAGAVGRGRATGA